MPQEALTKTTPKKVLDAGDGAYIGLQVLDASTMFFGKSREIMTTQGIAPAAPNSIQGFQLKTAQGVVQFWWTGELWALTDTEGSIINAEVLLQLPQSAGGGGCGCGGSCGGGKKNPPDIP